MFASKGFRFSALLATLIMAFSLVAVDTAEARRGGSFGSRGGQNMLEPAASPVSPKATTPVQRTMTDGTTTRSATGATTAAAARPSLFGGVGGAILGGLVGGLAGNQVGGGTGRSVATAAGAIAGALVGDRVDNANTPNQGPVTEQQVRQCRTVDHWESRTTGYEVTYDYRGRSYTDIMSYDPGERVRLHVNVEPSQR